MFGGDPFDPFGMRRQMNQIDRMMAEPFGMMNQMNNLMNQMIGSSFGHHPMLGFDNPRQSSQVLATNPRRHDPFGAMDLFGGGLMNGLVDNAMNDPNSMVFSQSTMITMNPDGTQRVVSNSTRKAGDVKETRHALRDGDDERVSVGHHIGNRTHYIEKKRDRDGQFRQQQKFYNMNEDDAVHFDAEFKARANRNLANLFNGRDNPQLSIDEGSNRRKPLHGRSSRPNRHGEPHVDGETSSSSEPIITEPDNDQNDDDVEFIGNRGTRNNQSRRNGPIIQEIVEEEEDQAGNNKRRRGLFNNYFRD